MAGLTRPRVLVVIPDHSELRRLADALRPCGYEVVEARSGEDALNTVRHGPIDVVILDWKLPGLSGAEVLALIKQYDPSIEIILVGKKPSANDLAAALRGRAADFLTAPVEVSVVREAIERALLFRTRQQVGRAVSTQGMAARLATLSEREAEIMRLLASGMNNKEIGRRLSISEKTVRNVLSKAYAKLQVSTRAEAVTAAREGMGHL